MNFIKFQSDTTNIFPLANSKTGGQLLSEFNLRSRESVYTTPSVKYAVGPSYVHSENDFKVRIYSDGAGNPLSSTTVEIFAGRAVINGHYFESHTNVTIDLAEANIQAKLNSEPALSGQLAVGLQAVYSTESTMSGALAPEGTDNMMQGVQVVILPVSDFRLPEDCPNDPDSVTAHIKLATLYYINGVINPNNIVNNPKKCQFLPAERISDIDSMMSDEYVTKSNLNSESLYIFSGKGNNYSNRKDTWCKAEDSMIVWDKDPKVGNTKPSYNQAEFGTDINGNVILYLPHKQVDGMMYSDGKLKYYQPRQLKLPVANFATGSSGTVDTEYTNNVKAVREYMNTFYRLPGGKQVGYIALLDSRDNLPSINPNWSSGDYVIVGQDATVIDDMTYNNSSSQLPSTMYVVIPGVVSRLKFVEARTDNSIPKSLKGIELARYIKNAANGDAKPNTSDADTYNNELGVTSGQYFGVMGSDYICVQYTDGDTVTKYYYAVYQAGSFKYIDYPIMLTGSTPVAQEEVVGGFLNVPETAYDNGYVYRDSDGHLRLLDYALLRSGTLAYQLGQDQILESGLSYDEIQYQLDEYINERVAFGNAYHKSNSTYSDVINITLNLSESTEQVSINIKDIDSRFGTSIYLHIKGDANSNTTINIINCEKIRIDSNIEGSPIINLYNSRLYYDASVIDSISIIQDLKLWYKRYKSSDPNLVVNDMTVSEIDAPLIPDDTDFWNESAPNDYHFLYALQSITFGSDGAIIGCDMYIKNSTTSNVITGDTVMVSEFSLPQGAGLTYPMSCLTKQLKISGTFVTAYSTTSPRGYMTMDTNFTALSQMYDPYTNNLSISGNIAFHVVATPVEHVIVSGVSDNGPLPEIDAWSSNSYHVFHGSVLG